MRIRTEKLLHIIRRYKIVVSVLRIGGELLQGWKEDAVTDPQYTYDNFITTDDIEKLFSTDSHVDLKPLFDLYLRTTQKLEIGIRQVDDKVYQVKLMNYFGTLPFEILVEGKMIKSRIDRSGITINSQGPPQIDPRGFYLKRVILE